MLFVSLTAFPKGWLELQYEIYVFGILYKEPIRIDVIIFAHLVISKFRME